jgi:hypothetical protein
MVDDEIHSGVPPTTNVNYEWRSFEGLPFLSILLARCMCMVLFEYCLTGEWHSIFGIDKYRTEFQIVLLRPYLARIATSATIHLTRTYTIQLTFSPTTLAQRFCIVSGRAEKG